MAQELLFSGLWPQLECCHGDNCQQEPTGSRVAGGRLGCQSCVSDNVPSPSLSEISRMESLAGLFSAYYLRGDLFLLELPIAHCQFRQNNSTPSHPRIFSRMLPLR